MVRQLGHSKSIWRFVPFFISYKFIESNRLGRTITASSQWGGKVRKFAVLLVQPRNTLRICKTPTVPLKSSAPLVVDTLVFFHPTCCLFPDLLSFDLDLLLQYDIIVSNGEGNLVIQ